ncbi:MAG: hypothetical protein M9894_26240 [Planctomycetes bacterium]|nr:hypothetical protein [Planctomycetota bacterium]
MSDDRLRDLERRWHAAGAPEDDARLLLERVRAGALTHDELGLAARLGHPGACAALGRRPDDLPALCAALAAQDVLRARAALALAEVALPAWTWPRPPEEAVPGEWVRDAVATLRAARARPGPGAAEAGLEAAGLARDAAYEARGDGLWRALAARVVGFAAEGLAEPRALLEAAWLGASLYSEARCRDALGRALLPAPLQPSSRAGAPPEWTSEVEWLRRRLEAGALTPDRVALARALGYGPAHALLGPPPPTTDGAWREAVTGSPLAREVTARALVALAVDRLERGADTAVGRAILAAEAWLLEPTPERAGEAARAAAEAARAPGSFRPTPEFHLASALRVETPHEPSGAELGALAARAAADDDPPGALDRALDLLAPGGVSPLDVIGAEVVPWSLGYHDPVRDRVRLGRDFVARLTSYD